MKHTFTPGPWETDLSGRDIQIYNHTGILVVDRIARRERLSENDDSKFSIIETANANLIASAPELLEALESITLSMKAHPDCTEGSEFADMVNIAEKAINKAKGL